MKFQHCALVIFSVCATFFSQVSLGQKKAKNTIQNDSIAKDSIVVNGLAPDSLYREDQFYLGVSFNLLSDLPKNAKQSGFSGGFHLGFIRDIPLNKRRNIAIGAGLGWSVNTYSLNVLVSEDHKNHSIFQVLNKDDIDYNFNRYTTYLVEAPIQFRWRTSTAKKYKFWRVYTGFRIGYLYHFKSNYKSNSQHIVQTQVNELNRIRYGATFTFGYNTFNFNIYYSLNPFFDGQTLKAGDPVGLITFKIGLMFYIL